MPHRSPTASDFGSLAFRFFGIPRISESKSETVVDSGSEFHHSDSSISGSKVDSEESLQIGGGIFSELSSELSNSDPEVVLSDSQVDSVTCSKMTG